MLGSFLRDMIDLNVSRDSSKTKQYSSDFSKFSQVFF